MDDGLRRPAQEKLANPGMAEAAHDEQVCGLPSRITDQGRAGTVLVDRDGQARRGDTVASQMVDDLSEREIGRKGLVPGDRDDLDGARPLAQRDGIGQGASRRARAVPADDDMIPAMTRVEGNIILAA